MALSCRFAGTVTSLNSRSGFAPSIRIFIAMLLVTALQLPLSTTVFAEPSNPKLSNDRCLRCHGKENFSRKAANGEARDLHVTAEKFEQSVHGSRDCVNCHKDIIKAAHRKGIDRKVGCVQCHQDLWKEAQESGTTDETPLLGVVIEQIESYMGSIHARPSIADQSRTNATCYNCHDAHYITLIDSHVGANGRLEIPKTCGQCHSEIRDTYMTSVHGTEISDGNANAAVCSDCHTTHNIEKPHEVSGRLVITENCGNCHQENLNSYMNTYHGKVTRLGYGETAKCYDCHGSHGVKRVTDESSMMHTDNRLETCQTCHAGATEGYITFQPHGTNDDFEQYPQMWLASKGMIGLLLGTFAFFWLHSALWFFREYQDRKHGKDRPHVLTEALPEGKTHFRRFTRWWRLAHLIGALSIMTLAVTGLTVLFAGSSWAPVVMEILGGPKSAGIIHRIGAIGFMGVFFIHLIYFAFHIGE